MTRLEVGAAQRPRSGELVCGDVSAVIPLEGGTLICLADGLGHGPAARESAELVCQHARAHAGAPLAALLRGIDGALAGKRGAAVSLLELFEDGLARFTGVGNVELRAVARAHIAPPTMAGIVGQHPRAARVWEYRIAPGDLVALLSDGISTRFDLATFAHLAPQALAEALVREHRKEHDDASCVVVRVLTA